MAHRTRLETLFEGDDAPVVHYNPNYKPRSLPSRPTNAKQFPSLANHYHTVHGHYNYPITTILEDPLSASTKYLDLPQQQLQQYHARGTTTSSTPSETTTPQQKFSLAHFWSRHLFTAPPAPPPQTLSASPSSSPPTPEPYRPTSAPPGAPNNTSPKISTHQQQVPRHPQRSASSSSSKSDTLSPSSSLSSASSNSSSLSSSLSCSESRPGSASSTCVSSDSGSTLSPSSTTSSSLSNLVLGTISKRSSRTGLTLPFTSSTKSPSLASAPVPLTTSTGSTSSTVNSGKTVPLARSQSHSSVMVKHNSPSVSSSATEKHLQQDEQDLRQPHVLSIKKRVASGQAQLDHYRSMISQLDQQSSVFVQQQQELKERRDHVARAVESLENVLHRPWQTTTTTPSLTKTTTDHATLRARSVLVDSEQAKQALAAKLGRRRSLPNASHAGEVVRGGTGREEGRGQGQGQGQGGGGGRGLFVFTQPSLWSSSSSHTPKAVVLHSHDVGDAEKDDTDDLFVHPVILDKRSSYPGSNRSQASLSPSSAASPPNAVDSSSRPRDDALFKADCERCILKDELLQKRSALQQIQGEIERLQQRLNSCASQVRMIQRTFVGPIEQHLAMDQSELGRIERAIGKSA
ncbi:hypothetical protein BG003_003237 [Podila horticola]|nr:hypothetical protein BG003_003237 [Podila horticola]